MKSIHRSPLLAVARDTRLLENDCIVLELMSVALEQLDKLDVYRHENGFLKITLGSFEGQQLRVHLWDKTSMRSSTSIHSHRHPILSRVVTGAFAETRWRPSTSGTKLRRFSFAPSSPGEQELVESGSLTLQVRAVDVRRTGEVYAIPLSDFHSVRVLDVPSVTIFTQDLNVRGEGIVASDSLIRPTRRPWRVDQTELDDVYSLLSSEIAKFSFTAQP